MRNARVWLLQFITGFLLFFVLFFHIIWLHYGKILSLFGIKPTDPIKYQDIVQRGKSVTLAIIYIIFLSLALFHGIIGLKNIIVETSIGHKLRWPIGVLLFIIGLTLFCLGSYATIRMTICKG
jgi:succinate dehydrogenase hydrophobic anchor subunit